MSNNRLILTAAILNSEREIEIYDWLGRISLEYHGQQNKRFETWIDKQASERFGTEIYKNWGLNNENKEFPKVRFHYRKNGIFDKFELTFYYQGKAGQYDYDAKEYKIVSHNEHETLMNIEHTSNIAQQCIDIVGKRRENLIKMKANLQHLEELETQHAKMLKAIETYNDLISWPLSDTLRIRAR